ncbi:MAG: Competence protein ComEC/Rec2-related protein [Nocardioides sp.]|nr:Competence protein ComEC/Rec2-related protein [Nocardioides sp.]
MVWCSHGYNVRGDIVRLIGIPLSLIAGLLIVQSPADANVVRDRDCGGFPSQQAAQLYYLNHNPAADPDGLDSDSDGVACESLGGPYYYGSNPNPGSNNPTPHPPKPLKPRPIKVVKVLAGDLLKLRQEGKPAYKVRLVGAEVKGNSCVANGARRDLKSWIKPGRVVTVEIDRRAPKRRKGVTLANVVTKRGNYTIGGTQVGSGWATVAKYRFSDRTRYERWAGQASYRRQGLYGECFENAGSEKNPYLIGTIFDFGSWRYQFAATDPDALPEMQAENTASPGSVTYGGPPAPGWVYVRVAVTVTRISAGSGAPSWLDFELARDSDRYDTFGSGTSDWCGTGPAYLDEQPLARGQSLTGYVCASVPAPLRADDTWVITSEDYKTERFIRVG